MRTKVPWAEERRAYYRLLRHLLTEEVQSSYIDDQSESFPARISDLLKELENRELSDKH